MTKIVLEARINEYAMRDANPHVPWLANEVVETAARCREAGASIVHFHARDVGGSPQRSGEVYADFVRKIRTKCDLLVRDMLGMPAPV